MATRSTIALVNSDGTVSQIYCHWDGYLEHNGKILLEHYNTYDRVEELMNLGNLSLLAPSVNPTTTHTFKNPEDGVCVAYGRDRGEDDTQARKYWDKEMYRLSGQVEEYNYLFENGEWYYSTNGKIYHKINLE
jgi:hypothetical protein